MRTTCYRFRRSGRTTRMVRLALEYALKKKRAVYILAANEEEKVRIQALVTERAGDIGHGIKVENANNLPTFNWFTGGLIGAHPNCVVIPDHLAIETHFEWAASWLEGWNGGGSVGEDAEPDFAEVLWKPTADRINALPDPLRSYIHDFETENAELRRRIDGALKVYDDLLVDDGEVIR